MTSKEDSSWRGLRGPVEGEPYQRYTMHRVANAIMLVCMFAVLICHIICFASLLTKHNELIDKVLFDTDHSKVCILYMDAYNPYNNATRIIEFKGKHSCDFAIYGSVALAILAVIMMIALAVRTLFFNKMNVIGLCDLIGVFPAVVLTFSVSVVVSIGRNVTCHNLGEGNCEDFAVVPPNKEEPRVFVYTALKNAETSSWVAFLFLTAVAVMVVVRSILWVRRVRQTRRYNVQTVSGLVNNEELSPPIDEIDYDKTPAAI